MKQSVQEAIKKPAKVNKPKDVYEQQADRIADLVTAAPARSPICGVLPYAQCLSQNTIVGPTDGVPASVDRVLAGSGSPLEPGFRRDMERRFGYNFSNVRVHSGSAADQSTKELGASAFTVGRDLVFGRGRFAPATAEGRRLIAHELTHVVQQSTGRLSIQRQPAGPSEIEMPTEWAFASDKRKRTWRHYARLLGSQDADRIRKKGKLTNEDREEVDAKLKFFEGDAKEAYIKEIKPTLIEVTRREIEMPVAYVGKLPAGEPAEQERIRRRREHTYRFFAKVLEHQDYLLQLYRKRTGDVARKYDLPLKEAYVSRLQRYLDEGMEANKYWDVEMIEQIIEERAPNAPWHEAARQEFLTNLAIKQREQAREQSLPTLSPYWQNQFQTLAAETSAWPEGLRVFARDLLWMWREQVAPYDNNPYLRDVIQPAVAEEMVFKEIMSQYELVLRDRDRAIQKECKEHPLGRLMKVWGDPCKPWFGDFATRAEDEMRNLSVRMKIFRDKDRLPYRDIIYFLQEYKKCVEALPTQMGEVHLQILQSWAMVQGAFAMAARPMKGLPTVAPTASAGLPPVGGRLGTALRRWGFGVKLSLAIRGTELAVELPEISGASGAGRPAITETARGTPSLSVPTPSPRTPTPIQPVAVSSAEVARPPAPASPATTPVVVKAPAASTLPPVPGGPVLSRPPIAPIIAAAKGTVGPALHATGFTHDQILDLFVRQFQRPGPPQGTIIFHPTQESYENAATAAGIKPGSTLGFFVSADGGLGATGGAISMGFVHLPPTASTLTVIHEALHMISRQSGVSAILGQFVEEGLTEWLARTFGPEPMRRVYDENVAFVRLLAGAVGEMTLRDAYLHRQWAPLRSALRNRLGGDADVEYLYRLLRRVGPNGENGQFLREAMDMLWPASAVEPALPSTAGTGLTQPIPGKKGPVGQRARSPKGVPPAPSGRPLDPVIEFNDAVELGRELVNNSVWLQELRRINGLEAARRSGEARDFIKVYSVHSGTRIDMIPANQASAYGIGPRNWGRYFPNEDRIVMHEGIFTTQGVNPIREIGHEVGAAELRRIYKLPKDYIPRVVDVKPDVRSRMGGDSLTHVIDTLIKVPD